ncbi:MAG TPA: FecR domain-containing protein, partial [Candidatus Polarisedimenticolaceae bacterium]|nr:FecR domain-containing protein [Candidatus Polarisedimenticolaceae bacterium]
VIFIALVGLSVKTELFAIQTGGVIHIEAIDGELLHVTDQGNQPLSVGQTLRLDRGDAVRTAKGSHALLRLADDSRVELRERSELAVKQQRQLWRPRGDALLALDRGSLIVEASPQGSGHLFVDTEDCRVSVKGTVFSVNTGFRGSRVSVAEGEVHVDSRGTTSVLEPGDQVTTREGLERVPLEQDFSWSRDPEKYRELLRQVHQLGREIEREVGGPEARHATTLLDLAPAGTVVYAAIPNVSESLGRAYAILQQRVQENAVLGEWWQARVAGPGLDRQISAAIDKIRGLGAQLGEEIVVTLQTSADGSVREPLILAQLRQPRGFRAWVEHELAAAPEAPISIVDGAHPVRPAQDGLVLWLRDDLLVLTPEYDRAAAFAAELDRGSAQTFATTPFHERLSAAYRDGVEWLVAVDAGSILHHESARSPVLESMGLLDLQHVVADHSEHDGHSISRAVLSFDQPRRGVTAWLAAPAAIGALDFVSPDAKLVAAMALEDPDLLVDKLFNSLSSVDPEFRQRLEEFQSSHGLDVRGDLAAPLGGEFAFALDTPVLPTPTWKLIVEVYDPSRLESTLERVVAQIGGAMVASGHPGLRLEHEQLGNRVYYRLVSEGTGLSASYVFHDGYLLAGPSREVLDLAIQQRASGANLPHSGAFLALLPQDGEVNFSAIVYQNLGALLGSLSQLAGGGTAEPSDDPTRRLLETLGSQRGPSLVLAYGEPDRITVVGTSEGGFLSSALGTLFSIEGLQGFVRQ